MPWRYTPHSLTKRLRYSQCEYTTDYYTWTRYFKSAPSRPDSITYKRPIRTDVLRSTWPTNIKSTRRCLNLLLHTAQETLRAVQQSLLSPKCSTFIKQHYKTPAQDVVRYSTQHTPSIQKVPHLGTAWSSVITIYLANVLGGGGRSLQVAWHLPGGLNIFKDFSLQSVGAPEARPAVLEAVSEKIPVLRDMTV